MKPYLRAQDARGRLWHVIQASTLDEEGRTQGAFFVFDQHGTVKDVFERTRAILLHAAQKRAVVALVKTTMDQPRATHSILVVGDFTEAVQSMCSTVEVIRLENPEDVYPAYQKALLRDDGRNTIIVEYGDYYNVK